MSGDSREKLEKAKNSIATNSKPKKVTTVRDECIRKAMLGMTCTPPYTVARFLDEVAAPNDGEEVFTPLNAGNCFSYNVMNKIQCWIKRQNLEKIVCKSLGRKHYL